MKYYDHPDFAGHEMVSFVYDEATHLKTILAIHNTHLGSAVGGTRIWAYTSDEAALTDALRLSHGMTLKCAMADLPFGGGKGVIIQSLDAVKDKKALFRAYAKEINRLDGLFITGEDVGFNEEYVDMMSEVTPYVFGRSVGNGGVGSPSPKTARGVLCGIRAAVKFQFKKNNLNGMKVAVQGLGSVGYALTELLIKEGATVVASDPDIRTANRAAEELKIKIVGLNEIYAQDVDIFAPCALGGILNPLTIPQLQAKVIAGCANNQLLTDACGLLVKEKNILYAPDYVINAGGVIWACQEISECTEVATLKNIDNIYERLMLVFERAKSAEVPTNFIADQMALEKIQRHDERSVA